MRRSSEKQLQSNRRAFVILCTTTALALNSCSRSDHRKNPETTLDVTHASNSKADRPGVRTDETDPGDDLTAPDVSAQNGSEPASWPDSARRDESEQSAFDRAVDTGSEPVEPDAEPRQLSVDDWLDRLLVAEVEEAQEAYRQLWEVRPGLVPALMQRIEDRRRTRLTELQIICFQPVGQFDQANDRVVYYVPGLAGARFDDVAGRFVELRKAYRVVLKRKDGFPLGVVVRAALLNRFRSPKYPRHIDDAKDLAGWWRAYYRAAAGRS